MALPKSAVLLVCAASLAACDVSVGNDAPPVEANASADGKAEDGRLTVSAPGFNMSIAIPEEVAAEARADGDDDLVYPGSRVRGLHIQGGQEKGPGRDGAEVELRFSTGDSADRVLAWYRDPARADRFTVRSAGREGQGYRLAGTAGSDGDAFSLSLVPAGDGTEGRLVISEAR